MAFFDQPVVRDPTPNSPREILARLATVLLIGSPLVAILVFPVALARRDERLLFTAYACAALAVTLLATRRFWRTPPAKADTGTAPRAASEPGPAGAGASDRPRILLLDASLAGPGGNSSRLLALLSPRLSPHAELDPAALSGPRAADFAALAPRLRAADAFVFATGTHWDSWSSALQKFLEDATPAEASELWLGKPAAVLVTEHSVGGKAVLSRLQGVLVTLGCSLPPLSGLVLSRAAHAARRHAPDASATEAAEDYWSPDDLDVVAHNLLSAARAPRPVWHAWPVDRRHFDRPWLDGTEAQPRRAPRTLDATSPRRA